MKQFSSQFKKQAESIRMRASEKRELKERIVSYMEYHPLPKEMRTSKSDTSKAGNVSIVSEPFFILNLNTIHFKKFTGVFAVLCILAVPFVAERSLPGDVLYPVKVEFNEELRSSLSFTPYAKVAWETERLERRISEVRLLASEGKLTPEVEAQFVEAVKTHADAAQREIATLKESNADQAAIAEIAFASALAVQSEVLEGHIEAGSEGETKEETAILAVAQVVQDARTSAAVVQNQTPASYESLLAAVELESTNMYELFSSVKTETSPDEAADIERRIEDIKRKVATAQSLKAGEPTASDAEVANVLALIQNDVQGGVNAGEDIALLAVASDAVPATKMAENTDALFSTTVASSAVVTTEALPPVMSQVDEQGAIDTLKLALTDIQKLINYLTNIDVRENVSIEKLVPVTKTAGERATEIKMIFDEVKLLSADVDSRTLSSKLRSKVRYGRERIEEKLTAVSEFMGRGDLEGAHAAASEARVMALDLQKLVANEPQKSVTEETTEEPVEEVETDVAEGVDAENQAQ